MFVLQVKMENNLPLEQSSDSSVRPPSWPRGFLTRTELKDLFSQVLKVFRSKLSCNRFHLLVIYDTQTKEKWKNTQAPSFCFYKNSVRSCWSNVLINWSSSVWALEHTGVLGQKDISNDLRVNCCCPSIRGGLKVISKMSDSILLQKKQWVETWKQLLIFHGRPSNNTQRSDYAILTLQTAVSRLKVMAGLAG